MTDFNPEGSAAVQQRLGESAAGKPFTSDLGVEDYVLLQEAGFQPLGLVVGASVYHVGIQVGRWKENFELTTMSQAMYNARSLAMQRMLMEAHALGADGVVAVKLTHATYAWGQGMLEFSAVGTAVRFSRAPGTLKAPSGWPFTSALSAREFYLLHKAGSIPVSMVLGVCVYHVAHLGIAQAMGQAGQNVEVQTFTQGVYDARELALGRMQLEADTQKASGIIGVRLLVQSHVWGEHATEFYAIGTAIRPADGGQPIDEPSFVFTL
ncbi:MAG: hypothetical protein JWM34_2703 [Ilumatobacteraceae bacterium]|nr:hypothetical protein [Ilumatobacteraceae bacterium]